MVLDFYRYGYDQIRLAKELNLGTCAAPNGLPYPQVGEVVTAIENLTSKSLDATMYKDPDWALFESEIVDALIDTKKIREYDAAIELLRDLRDLSQRDGDPDTFHKRLHILRQQYAGRPGLLHRLDRAGLTQT